MAISLSCKLTSPKISVPPRPNTLRGHTKSNVICCRATKNHHKVLSLDANAGIDEIKKACRNMAIVYHPDVCDPSKKEESTRMFVELHEAYRTLIDQTSSIVCSLNVGKIERRNGEGTPRDNWKNQVSELNRRSREGTGEKQGSWVIRMRAQAKYA